MTDVACVVEAHDTLGENCLWCPVTRRVWWLNIQGPSLQSYDPASRAHRVYPLPGRFCGYAALRKSGGLALGLDNGLHGFDPESGGLEFLVRAENRPGNRYNDGRCDRRGRLWLSTMHVDTKQPTGSLYRIDADCTVERQFDGITIGNSSAFSPDDRTFYFADTPKHVIWAFDFDLGAGAISGRRVFAETGDAHPDGSCVDAEGFLWNAKYGGHHLTRYAPDGKIDRTVQLPVVNPTCCCFGGDNLDTLYVTSAAPPGERGLTATDGGLLALDVGVRGLPEAAFAA